MIPDKLSVVEEAANWWESEGVKNDYCDCTSEVEAIEP